MLQPGPSPCTARNADGTQCALALDHDGPHRTSAEATAPRRQAMITRTYKASSQAKAANKMAAEGAPPGHVFGGQSWAQGGRSCAAQGFVVVGVLLLVVGLVFPPLWALAIICLVIGLVSAGRMAN